MTRLLMHEARHRLTRSNPRYLHTVRRVAPYSGGHVVYNGRLLSPEPRVLKRLKPMLYRGMDRAQLDAAYDNLAAVTASAKLLADWAARSARFRERHRGHLGLAYGEQPRERLDLFLAGNPAAPTLAYIHGGYWQMTFQTKEMYSALAEGAVSHGLNVAVVEYTLAPEARMDRIVGEAMTMPLGAIRGGIAISGVYELEPIRLNYL